MKLPHAARGHPPLALVNGRLVLPHREARGRALVLEDERIVGLVAEGELSGAVRHLDLGSRLVLPGLVDIHIHGAGGQGFNEAHPAGWATIRRHCAAHGVTSVVATLAAAPVDEMLAALDLCERQMVDEVVGSRLLGTHLEGPYLAPAQKGAQDEASLRVPRDDDAVEAFMARARTMRMVTLAPELPGALELVARLARAGIVPAAGHSQARDTDVARAIGRGLRHVVHLWSGQSSTVREGSWRRPGLLEASLAFPELTAEIIADGCHLPATLMALAYRCKGPDALCVVSDAVAGAGLPEGSCFRLGHQTFTVRDGVGQIPDGSAFAGSVTLLDGMLPVLVERVGLPLVEAVRMASLTPARVVGRAQELGSLEVGKLADLTIVDMAEWRVWATMVGGRWVYRNEEASRDHG